MEFKYKHDDPTSHKKLCKEINRNILISKNAELFKKDKNLVKINLHKPLNKEDLPIQSYLGTCYLIKNNSILEFCSTFEYKRIHILDENQELVYKSLITTYNLDQLDVSDFENDDFINMDDLVSYSSDDTASFVYALVRSGFNIWIRSI